MREGEMVLKWHCISKMHTANCYRYCKIISKIAYCKLLPLYCKIITKIHTANKNCYGYCKIISKLLVANFCFCTVLLSLQARIKFAYCKLLLKFMKYFEFWCHLKKYSPLSVRPSVRQMNRDCFSAAIFSAFTFRCLVLMIRNADFNLGRETLSWIDF